MDPSKTSRYSFLRLAESFRTAGSESTRFSYPPQTPEYPMPTASTSKPPQPAAHPYQLATGLASPTPDPEANTGTMRAAQDEVLSRPALREIDKEPSSTSENVHSQPTQPYNSNPTARPRSRTPQLRSPFLEKYKLPIYLLLFLPVPPLLSLIYVLIGHAIMRHAQPAPNPAWLPTFLSTAGAAATGGIILSLPLALLFYLLLFPTPREVAPADFFEDDESLFTRLPAVKYAAYTMCGITVVLVGTMAGPLGVTCVSGSEGGALSPRNAAVAGLLGGVILCGGICIVGGLGVAVLVATRTSQRTASS